MRARWVEIAVVLLAAHGRALGDGTTSRTIIYGDPSTQIPLVRTLNGTTWSTTASTVGIGGTAQWGLLKNCPVRNELVAAFSDNQDDLNAFVFNGTSWDNLVEASTNLVTSGERPFFVAYEQISGRAMLAYRVNSVSTIYYRIWDGSAWSDESSVAPSGTGDPKWIKIVPKPSSNEMMLLNLDNNNDLTAMIWNGSTFGNKVLLDSSVAFTATECFDAAYEGTTNRCVVAWATNGTTVPKYRVWDGAVWKSAADMPDVGGNVKWMRLAADSATAKIIALTLDGLSDVNATVWSGSSWGSVTEFETSAPATDRRGIDVAFQPNGYRALAMWSRSGQETPYYRAFSGYAWGSESAGPNLGSGSRPSVIQFVPATTGPDIAIAILRKSDGALAAMRWTGLTVTDYQSLAADVSGPNANECFMISNAAPSALVPANVPYYHDFESAMGAEWSDSTRSYASAYTNFAGRQYSKALRLALNTTAGQTYALWFDFYAIDSWDGTDTVDNYYYGPDAFYVSVDGTTLLSHTLVHSWPELGATYPYPYDSKGNYGFNSGWEDAIYRCMATQFTATSSTSVLYFYGTFVDETDEGLINESWGLDNIRVETARFVDASAAKGFAVSSSSSGDYGPGIHPVDLDNDGDVDFILTGDSAKQLTNISAGTSFTSANLGDYRCQGGFLDFENDGDIDFFIGCAGGANTEALLLNNGSGALSTSGNGGLSGGNANEGLAIADTNADGFADVLLFSGSSGNWLGLHNASSSAPALAGTIAASYGLNNAGDFGNGDYVAAGDVNKDGYLDFFYTYNGGKLFVSRGDGTYSQNAYGISISTGDTKNIAAAFADYDNDGDLDLFVARNDEARVGYLFRNDRNWTTGSGNFTDVTAAAGLGPNTGAVYTPSLPGTRSVAWGDVDDDGDLDLYVVGANGNCYLFKNNNNGTFTRSGEGALASGAGADACLVDIDNDGDLDLVVSRVAQTAVLLQNRTDSANYLLVRVLGKGAGGANKAAIGTRVELWNAANTTFIARRDLGVARGLGTEPLWAHFGGVTPSTTYTVRVYYPGQTTAVTQTVVPSATSSTIGSTTIPKMLTIQQTGIKIIKWRDVPNPDPLTSG
ncbi:MAG: VCBS repeat-containing protein [Phycisphaerae bacterium]